MNNSSERDCLDTAFQKVLSHPSFSRYTRENLGSCEKFCEMLREAQLEDILQCQEELEEIAYETDDHNEASGFLLALINLGGGFDTFSLIHDENAEKNGIDVQSCRAELPDIPVTDTEHFFDWAISVPTDQRVLAYASAMEALLKRVVRIKEDDYTSRLTHHQINIVLHYVLRGAQELLAFGNSASDNLEGDFNILEQIPPRLWEGFITRGDKEVSEIINHWWGPGSATPQDFFIALEWQRAGCIKINKGKYYYDAVAEYLLNSCEPGVAEANEPVRGNHGIDAIRLDPFLEQELYEAVTREGSYRWLISENIPHRVSYLNSLFKSEALNRERILSALDNGISRNWDKGHIDEYKDLRERLVQ